MIFGYGHSIDTGMVADLAGINNYWAGAYKFLTQIEDKRTHELTQKQHEWIAKIARDHVEQYEKHFK